LRREMSAFNTERVLKVRHWNDTLFSFTTTRDPGLRFENGQFVMMGLHVDGRPLTRAYSIASANHEEHLEFFSIKVQNGALTSRLQHLLPGHEVLVSRKPTGSLLIDDLKPGKHVYLLSSGTGLAPFMSLVKDPLMYEKFEKVILLHSVRATSELQLIYFPTVTREPYRNRGRLTDLIESGKLFEQIGLPPLNPEHDRAMICGSPSMLKDLSSILDARGFHISKHIGAAGDYVIERAFVEK
jgi:ferredoxin/flavodoxin---NADP+ reductase